MAGESGIEIRWRTIAASGMAETMTRVSFHEK
jgi:hypothetical protein